MKVGDRVIIRNPSPSFINILGLPATGTISQVLYISPLYSCMTDIRIYTCAERHYELQELEGFATIFKFKDLELDVLDALARL